MATPLDIWSWVTLGCGLLVLTCFAVVFRREWRRASGAPARWILASSSAGLVLITLAATFPLSERLGDLLALSGAVVLLAAYVAKWRGERKDSADGGAVEQAAAAESGAPPGGGHHG